MQKLQLKKYVEFKDKRFFLHGFLWRSTVGLSLLVGYNVV
jgi:hypothetical protein